MSGEGGDAERTFLDIYDEYLRSLPQLEAERRAWIEKEVYARLQELRRESGFMVHLDISVLVPVCLECKYAECRAVEIPHGVPDVWGGHWRVDYLLLGIHPEEIERIERALLGGWVLRCSRCKVSIDVESAFGFYLERESLTDHFDLPSRMEDRVRPWMKDLVFQVFGKKCAVCQKDLRPGDATVDHILATSKGGMTELPNLQPMCRACNEAKADKDVETVEIDLTFALRPPPSDGYDGVIW